MDSTSDNDVGSSYHPVFVRPSPTTFVLPDDHRLQTSTRESAYGNFHHSRSSLRLVSAGNSTQRCSCDTVSTLCYERCNSTRSLLSIAEFDGQHSNVDAHSFEIQPTEGCCAKEDHATSCSGEVHLISIKPDEILSQIRKNPPCLDPVPFRNQAANSAIEEVTLTGLHNGESHVSIVEIKFKSWQQIDLSDVKSLTIKIQDVDHRSKRKITGSVISHTGDNDNVTICTVLRRFLLHMQIFYWKHPFIDMQVELLDHDDEVDQFSASNSSDTYPSTSPCAHATVIPPRPLIMSTLPDDDRILHNQPLPDTMVCVSGTEAAKFYLVHSHDNGDDENRRAMQPPAPANMDAANDEIVEVSNSSSNREQNNFSINLDCRKLYSIISSQEIIQYPCSFRTTLSFKENVTIPIILRILPLKCGGKHISLWAEISSPVPQCLPLHQITVEAIAYNPSKDRSYGRLGEPVRCTEKFSDVHSKRAMLCQLAFMLKMNAFYNKQVQIDIKTY